MDTNSLSLIFTGGGAVLQLVSTTLQTYSLFKKTNVEKYLEELVECKQDLSKIAENESSIRYFFKIIDEVSKEANIEKIKAWKNATIHLATDFCEFNFKDNFIKILSDLTVFDLTVLNKIYTIENDTKEFLGNLKVYFRSINIEDEHLLLSIKTLSSHGLISEQYKNNLTFYGSNDAPLEDFKYIKNSIGKDFLKFVAWFS